MSGDDWLRNGDTPKTLEQLIELVDRIECSVVAICSAIGELRGDPPPQPREGSYVSAAFPICARYALSSRNTSSISAFSAPVGAQQTGITPPSPVVPPL